MKDDFNKYGKRLTEREYMEAVACLMCEGYRKNETDLMIDHRLGEDYPREQRELIYKARERATKKFILSPIFAIKAAVINAGMRLGFIKGMPGLDDGDIDRGTRIFAEEFTKEKSLATEDIIQFLGEESAVAVRKLRNLSR